MRDGHLKIDVYIPFNHEGPCDDDDPDFIDCQAKAVELITWNELRPVAGQKGVFEYRCTEEDLHVTVRKRKDGTFSVDTDRHVDIDDNTLRTNWMPEWLWKLLGRSLNHPSK